MENDRETDEAYERRLRDFLYQQHLKDFESHPMVTKVPPMLTTMEPSPPPSETGPTTPTGLSSMPTKVSQAVEHSLRTPRSSIEHHDGSDGEKGNGQMAVEYSVKYSDMDEKKLEALLVRKLAGMPKDHLPILKLTDILGQTPMAAHLLHIPSDLQLTFFLANRSVINANLGLAIKDSSQQSLDITRAIFFYRLDTAHQFARYHDSSRWNISLYIALLSLPPHATSFYSPTYISPAARRFMLSYLDAVVETHNEPYTFGRREAFIDLWKESAYDFFSIKAASQAKFIRRQTVRLNAEWEAELDGMRKSMKQDDYKARVVPWVGVLIPGRVDQGRRVVGINAGARGANNTGKQDVRDKSNVEEGRNKLLEALMVPLDEMEVDVDGQSGSAQYELVCKLPAALAALKNMSAKEMLAALFRMF